jgi:DNA-directed RNA polymerase specialized sigma24 family protein
VRGVTDSHHAAVAGREELSALLDLLQAELSETAFALFIDLYVEQHDASAVAAAHGLTLNAVYIWRTRLRKRAKAALNRLKTQPRTIAKG